MPAYITVVLLYILTLTLVYHCYWSMQRVALITIETIVLYRTIVIHNKHASYPLACVNYVPHDELHACTVTFFVHAVHQVTCTALS